MQQRAKYFAHHLNFPCNSPSTHPSLRWVSKDLTIESGQIVTGPLFNEPMRVETVQPNGNNTWVLGLVGVQSERFRRVTITSEQISSLTIFQAAKSFDGDGALLRLGLLAYALGI